MPITAYGYRVFVRAAFFSALDRRAATPFMAAARRSAGVSVANPFLTFFAPPSRPSATAAGFFDLGFVAAGFFAIATDSTT